MRYCYSISIKIWGNQYPEFSSVHRSTPADNSLWTRRTSLHEELLHVHNLHSRVVVVVWSILLVGDRNGSDAGVLEGPGLDWHPREIIDPEEREAGRDCLDLPPSLVDLASVEELVDGAEGMAGDGDDQVDHVGGAWVLGGLVTKAEKKGGP